MGRTIVGATRLIKELRKKAVERTVDPRKKHSDYRKRDECLPMLGYANYKEYLNSPEWVAIRTSVLSLFPNCLVCGNVASEVHHLSYLPRVLLGLENRLLVSLCRGCHARIEFDGKRKRTLREANDELRLLAFASGKHSWLAMTWPLLQAAHQYERSILEWEKRERHMQVVIQKQRETARAERKKKKAATPKKSVPAPPNQPKMTREEKARRKLEREQKVRISQPNRRIPGTSLHFPNFGS